MIKSFSRFIFLAYTPLKKLEPECRVLLMI